MPPPPVEVPAELPVQMKGKRKLTDAEVAEARRVVATVGTKELAKRYGVTYNVMWKAVKGWSYRHLNLKFPPQW